MAASPRLSWRHLGLGGASGGKQTIYLERSVAEANAYKIKERWRTRWRGLLIKQPAARATQVLYWESHEAASKGKESHYTKLKKNKRYKGLISISQNIRK